jgi:hypothetical protein
MESGTVRGGAVLALLGVDGGGTEVYVEESWEAVGDELTVVEQAIHMLEQVRDELRRLASWPPSSPPRTAH